jgi:hypothetical protein
VQVVVVVLETVVEFIAQQLQVQAVQAAAVLVQTQIQQQEAEQ